MMVSTYGLLFCGSALIFATLLKGQSLSCILNRTCGRCIEGYYNGYLHDDNRTTELKDCSLRCRENCEACTSYKNCTKCKTGFCIDHVERNCKKDCSVKYCETCTSCNVCLKCSDGYYGKTCDERCGYGCKDRRCDMKNGSCLCRDTFQGQRCDRCPSGYYGHKCEKNCPKDCQTNMCDMQRGDCVIGCKEGFKQPNCESCIDGFFRNGDICEKCPNTCLRCTNSNHCSDCKPRSWGPKCQQACSSKCVDQICNQNGLCRNCTDGSYGGHCESKCPITCATNSCDRDGNCFACKKGYFGVNCSNTCPSNCKGKCQKDGHCRSCIDGYFGNVCDKNCPDNCLRCISQTNCTHCKPGFRGNICEDKCSNCQPGTKCRQHDTYCEEDCADGLYGPMCDQTCPNECKTCDRNSNFKCSSCIHGKYGAHDISGETHYLTCKINCSQACLNSSCNEEDGRCLNGCVQGFWGAFCDSLCPANCKNRKCFDNDGACVEGCKEGLFGRKCSQRCNLYDMDCLACLTDDNDQYKSCSRCKKGHFLDNDLSDQLKYKQCGPCSSKCSRNECNTTNGFCQHGCKIGLWGRQCEKTCDFNCVGCEQYNGDCLNCTDGRHGIKCLENCSTHCGRKNGVSVCSQYDGQCLSECTNGFHGQFCDMPCSKNCANNTCNKLGGDCSVGCLPGFDGTTCTQVNIGTSKAVIIAIIGTSSVLVVGVLICITVAICIKVHKRKRTISSMEMEEQSRNINDEDEGLCDANSRTNMATARRTEHRNVDDKDVETRIEYANISSKPERCLTKEDASEEVEIDSYEDEKLRRVELTQTVCKHYHYCNVIKRGQANNYMWPYRIKT